MDCEPEDLQYLSILGIYKQTSKIISSWRNLFTQITLSLILPLSLLFLAHIHISHLLFSQINRNEFALEQTPDGSPSQKLLIHRLSSDWSAFIIFKSVYLISLLIFSLLSTAAVVYIVASAHTAKHDLLLSYRKVLSVVPKVWRRLALTFLFAFFILVAYNIIAIFAFLFAILIFGENLVGFVVILVLCVGYIVGLVLISVIWHLASVVSVIEDACGLDAMKRSRDLVRGKMGIAAMVFVKMNLVFIGIELVFRGGFEMRDLRMDLRIGFGMVMLGLMSVVVLFALVVQTVLYFVCKSYHNESIDKSALADHLEVYLGEYLLLKEKDLQMEQMNV